MVRDSHIKQQVAQSFAIENQKAAHLFDDEKHALYSQLKLEGILEAPLNIAVFYKPSTNAVLGQNSMAETGEYSVVCAIQNMWLMARALNVGLGWVSIIDPQTVKTILHAPADNKLVAYLCLGYVDEFYDQPELEKRQWEKRKQIESVVYQDRY